MRPSFGDHHDAILKNRLVSGKRMIPKSGVRFSDKIMRRKGRRSAERRMPTMSAHTDKRRRSPMLQARLRAIVGGAPAFRRFTAALATGYHPDGSAPEPGFLKTRRQGVLPVRRRRLELSTLRADRSFCRPTGAPEPPGSGSHPSARGDRACFVFRKCPRERRPQSKQVRRHVTILATCVKPSSRSR
jgi:hypothetical protein